MEHYTGWQRPLGRPDPQFEPATALAIERLLESSPRMVVGYERMVRLMEMHVSFDEQNVLQDICSLARS